MPAPVVLAVASAACFLALAHMAVVAPFVAFRRMTTAMAVSGVLVAVFAPAAGVAVLAPVLLARRLAGPRVPATVPELLDRYSA